MPRDIRGWLCHPRLVEEQQQKRLRFVQVQLTNHPCLKQLDAEMDTLAPTEEDAS